MGPHGLILAAIEKYQKILKFSDSLGFAIGKIKRGHLEWSGVFPLGLDRHKRVYKVSEGQLPTDFFEFQCDTFLRR